MKHPSDIVREGKKCEQDGVSYRAVTRQYKCKKCYEWFNEDSPVPDCRTYKPDCSDCDAQLISKGEICTSHGGKLYQCPKCKIIEII